MAKIIGLGGVFLQFKGEKKLVQKWYSDFLSLDMGEFGTGFIEGEQLVLITFERSSKKSPYLNFRVDNIEDFFQKIKDADLNVVQEIQSYEYGKFGQFEDPFGNIIELWEPVVDSYKTMVKKEIEAYKKSKLN